MHRITTRVWMSCVGVAAVWAAAAACASAGADNALRIDATSPAHPVFLITVAGETNAAPFPFYGLVVSRCGSDRVMWQIGASANTSSPERVEYGVVPRGYAAGVPARPLGPGCYNVYISGPVRARFTVPAAARGARTDSVVR